VHHRPREGERRGITLLGEPVDLRATGVAEPDEPRDLVEGLTGGVVDRAAEVAEDAVLPHRDDRGVPARHDQREQRRLQLAVLELRCLDVGTQVVDAEQRHVVRQGHALRGRHADQQCPDQPGARGHRDRVDVGQADAGLHESLVDGRDQLAEVGTGGHLGDDTAVGGMELGLRRDDVGAQAEPVLDDTDGGLVTGGLDPEHQHVSGPLGRRRRPDRAPARREPAGAT